MDVKTKKIILLSDGTGNSAASRDRSNVWRLYDALDLQREDQVAFYDDGVGSQEFMLFKILGGAFGYGLKRNVLELYKMLCRSYREGDSIYLFGFSRGAFTVRVLAGMIASCGLQTGVADEKELDRIARQNYNALRAGFRQTLLSRLYRRIRRLGRNSISNARPDIQFVGVWDTVDAYGLPIDELSVLWDRYVFPIRFPDRDLSEKVVRGCHAVSVDDERLTFHPLLWNEAGEKSPERIEQVWFAGVHADVGGGYPLDNLSLVSLDWMISRIEAGADAACAAAAHRLHFIPAKREEIIRHADWHGVQHDSRAGVAAYYRYKPRAVGDLCNDAENGVRIERPKIHRSVLERIRRDIVHYLPTGLPADYAVVATRGPARQYEQQKEAADRFEAMHPALDVIFWRRWLYGFLLATTVLFVGSRFYLDWTPGGSCVGRACVLDPLLLSARAFLPDFAAGWIDAWRQNPTWLWAILFGFGFFSWLKYRAWRATQAHARAAWGPLKGRGRPGAGGALPAAPAGEPGMVRRFREKAHSTFRTRSKWLLAHLVMVVIVYLLVALSGRAVLHVRASFGGLCAESEQAVAVESATFQLAIANPCMASGVRLEAGARYRFETKTEGLRDGAREAGPAGYSSPGLAAWAPLRRHIGQPWLKLMGRAGARGDATFVVGAGRKEYTATTGGELFVYVNDAVFGLLPGSYWALPYFWSWGPNQGTVTVTVTRLPDGG